MVSSDWMYWATDWFAGMRECHASQSVVYIYPGVTEVQIEHATITTVERTADEVGIGLTSELLAWIVDPKKLQSTVDIRYPSPGDIIQAEFNGQVIDFEVCARSESVPCWQWLDNHRKMIQVYCKTETWPDFLQRR